MNERAECGTYCVFLKSRICSEDNGIVCSCSEND